MASMAWLPGQPAPPARSGAVTGEAAPPVRRRTVDVALEARVRRWTVDEVDRRTSLISSVTVQPDEPAEGEIIRVGSGGVMRVAVLAGGSADLEQVLRRAVLASGADLVLLLRSNDVRSFVVYD